MAVAAAAKGVVKTGLTHWLILGIIKPMVYVVLCQAQRTILVGTHGVDSQGVVVVHLLLLLLLGQAHPDVVLEGPPLNVIVAHGLHGVIYAQQHLGVLMLQDGAKLVLALVGVLDAARYRAIGHGNVLNVVIKFAAFITPVGMGYEYM
jgi:hypothetical protein